MSLKKAALTILSVGMFSVSRTVANMLPNVADGVGKAKAVLFPAACFWKPCETSGISASSPGHCLLLQQEVRQLPIYVYYEGGCGAAQRSAGSATCVSNCNSKPSGPLVCLTLR